MEVYRRSSWLLLLLGTLLLATTLQVVQGEVESEGPSESECRPYIEKALKELEVGDADDTGTTEADAEATDSKEDIPTVEITTDDSAQVGDDDTHDSQESTEVVDTDKIETESVEQEDTQEESSEDLKDSGNTEVLKGDEENDSKQEADSTEDTDASTETRQDQQSSEAEDTSVEQKQSTETHADEGESVESTAEKDEQSVEENALQNDQESKEDDNETAEEDGEKSEEQKDDGSSKEGESEEAGSIESDKQESIDAEVDLSKEDDKSQEDAQNENDTEEDKKESKEDREDDDTANEDEKESAEVEDNTQESGEDKDEKEESEEAKDESDLEKAKNDKESEETDDKTESVETEDHKESIEEEDKKAEESGENKDESEEQKEEANEAESSPDSKNVEEEEEDSSKQTEEEEKSEEKETEESGENGDSAPEEELSLDIEIPTDLRPRDHVEQLLKLDEESSDTENIINSIAEITLKELKKLYENAIKPLEVLYKYRDLSNRHFGDSEIFSKPLILFMGPWSGGKSSIINYLVNNEYNETALRTGAEPSPAYFNILMYGDEPEVIDGTQLAADFTFSGLQKFGQGLEERLRGVKLPSKLLEKVNIVEIPGILEVRKQVSRVFPFNDACQWFIDRADIIFLVYDPSKLDVGPETEAILDQLKGREHQTRIILNKADQVKPEELMRVQGALIWNISPLMSSAQPPIMYTTSLWSRPYETWAPVKLLQAQERAFLRDLRSAVDKRIENKIASARRFAVRVRNHAKMVDCYLTTYYNHKSVFGNRKQVADEIIEHPQDYHIYEGLSTLTNISRYDLPDPDVYRDFFKLNPLYDFQQLSATCTYFRGCPINRLDIAIAYDLPELVGKHKRLLENALAEANPGS